MRRVKWVNQKRFDVFYYNNRFMKHMKSLSGCGKCYIMTIDMDFGFLPGDPCALPSCHIVIRKQGVGSASG